MNILIDIILINHIHYMISFLSMFPEVTNIENKKHYIQFNLQNKRSCIKVRNPSRPKSIYLIDKFYNTYPGLKTEAINKFQKDKTKKDKKLKEKSRFSGFNKSKLLKERYETYLKSPEWKAKSLECIVSAGRRCEVCSSTKRLQSHHYNYIFLEKERPQDLFCLCSVCHEVYHSVYKPKDLPTDENKTRHERLVHITTTIRLS